MPSSLKLTQPQVLEALERWIWPTKGHPVYFFSWPFEQNALSTVIFHLYPDVWTLLRPGCPFNSPFGAFFRHLVGGTPDRNVYHPSHRNSWLLQAVRCTAQNVVGAATQSSAAPQSCTPNEPHLRLNATGCDQSEAEILTDTYAVNPSIIARVRAADWKPCCALCNSERACDAWSFASEWPKEMLNCWLLRDFTSSQHFPGRWLARKKTGKVRDLISFAVPERL